MSKLPKEIDFLKVKAVWKTVRICISFFDILDRVKSKIYASAQFPKAKNLACHSSVEIKYRDNIDIGQGVVIGKNVTLGALGGIEIMDNVRISKGVSIESASLDFSGLAPYKHISKKIVIEENVWIGTDSIILAGVCIGKNSIIGAGTVVSKSVPPDSIVVGQKARVLKKK